MALEPNLEKATIPIGNQSIGRIKEMPARGEFIKRYAS